MLGLRIIRVLSQPRHTRYKLKSTVCSVALVSVQSYPGHTTHFFLCLTSININQCTSSAISYNIHFFFLIMSSFLLKKKAYAGSFAFVSNWRNRLPNCIECLWRPITTMLYRKQRAEIGFAGSMTTILICMTRNVKIGPGRLRIVNFRIFWTRTIPNRKKYLPSNWVFLKQLFPCGYMPWGRFKRSGNESRMN